MCNAMAFAYGILTPHRTNLIVGVSIVIGAIGGVYLLQRGARHFCQLTEKKPRKKPDDICNVCFTKLDVEDFKSCVTCCNCQKFVCRGRQCTIWIPSQAGWECQLCSLSSESRSRASEWLHKQINEKYMRPMSSRSNPSIPTKDYCNDFDTNSEAPSSYCSEQREKVRGFVEEALAQILGGSLDNVSVGQMFKSQEYLPLWESEECPGVSHVKLKRLIEKIIQETLRLPALFDYSGIPGRTEESLPFFDPKKYQELLATAVLNKIVDSYNYEKKFELGNNNEDLDKNHNPIITAKNKIVSQSSSSIEPGSDSSITDTAVNIRRDDDAYPSDTDSNLHSDLVTGSVHTGDESVLSDYVARHKVPLPELTLDIESPDDDTMSVVTTKSTEGNWEDNWLFKKKKRGNEATASVGMLVPSPREDIRTLIGDKTADEVSDLSEGSDFEDNECNDMKTQNDTDLPNVLIQNKNVIGGKSTVGLFDELLEQTSMISTTSIQDGEAAFTECKNEHVLNDEGLNDVAAPPKLDLSNNNAQIVVESEAINSYVNSEIFTNGAASQQERLVLSPPEHFEDSTEPKVTETSSEENNETETNLDSLEQVENMAKAEMNSSPKTSEVVPNITPEIERHKELPTNLATVESTQDTSIPTNKTTNSSDSADFKDSQKHQKHDILKNTTFSNHLRREESADETLGQLLPGSIAERERLKWYSAVEMPNNPYSPEALKQRLSIGSEKPMDIPNISTSIDLTSSQEMPNQIDETAEGASKLQIVIGAHKPDQRRYGRDYYINEAKYVNIIASGDSESVKETEELSSTLSLNNEDQHMENQQVKQYSTESTTNSSNLSVRRSSSGSEKPSLENCDLFTAKPVRVEESDPILNKAIKLEYLSTPERDFYLLPSEEVENLKTPNQSDTSSQLSQNLDSLTASEDSDTIRVYDLQNQETRIIKDEKLKENLEPDIKKQRPNILSLTPKVGQQLQQQQPQKKIITPTSLKFLQPKRKLFDPRRIMSVDSGLKSPIFDNNPMMINTSSLDSPDKTVIEEELISALPSVKALAKAFSNNTDSTPVTPVYKSKATTLNSVEVKSSPVIHEEIHEEVTEEAPQPTEVVESVVSVTHEEPVEHLNEVTETSEIVQEFETLVEAEENHVEEHHPEIEIIVNVQKHDSLFESSNERSQPERPISPVLVPGLLKNNIAFFENLKNK